MNKRDVQTGCTGYVHKAAIWGIAPEYCFCAVLTYKKSRQSKLKLLDDRYSPFFMTNKIMGITDCIMFFKLKNCSVQRFLWQGWSRIHSSVLTTQYSRVLLNRLLFYSCSSSFLDKHFYSTHYIFWKVMVLLLEYVFSVLFLPLPTYNLFLKSEGNDSWKTSEGKHLTLVVRLKLVFTVNLCLNLIDC